MTTQEFSDMFDTLLNSYASQAIFGEGASKQEVVLDEYEKSVLLTQAQDIIVKNYFYGNQNPQGQGFDDSIRRQVDFSSLIKTETLSPADSPLQNKKFDDRGIIYLMPQKGDGTYTSEQDRPTDVLYILNEKMIVHKYSSSAAGHIGDKINDFVVVPLNYKEYDREMSKAYAQPFKKQAWRLFQNSSTGFDVQSELIPLWNISENNGGTDENGVILTYRIRYVKRPDPIILAPLPNHLKIDGLDAVTECSLNPIVHMDILNKAVEIALSTRGRIAAPANRGEK